jgi:hypothetical protein
MYDISKTCETVFSVGIRKLLTQFGKTKFILVSVWVATTEEKQLRNFTDKLKQTRTNKNTNRFCLKKFEFKKIGGPSNKFLCKLSIIRDSASIIEFEKLL